jgi:hypothetical protein
MCVDINVDLDEVCGDDDDSVIDGGLQGSSIGDDGGDANVNLEGEESLTLEEGRDSFEQEGEERFSLEGEDVLDSLTRVGIRIQF